LKNRPTVVWTAFITIIFLFCLLLLIDPFGWLSFSDSLTAVQTTIEAIGFPILIYQLIKQRTQELRRPYLTLTVSPSENQEERADFSVEVNRIVYTGKASNVSLSFDFTIMNTGSAVAHNPRIRWNFPATLFPNIKQMSHQTLHYPELGAHINRHPNYVEYSSHITVPPWEPTPIGPFTLPIRFDMRGTINEAISAEVFYEHENGEQREKFLFPIILTFEE
jgi:hypothetical protein